MFSSKILSKIIKCKIPTKFITSYNLKVSRMHKSVFIINQLNKYQIMCFSSMKTRLEMKSQLKEFYKFTHPDLFTNAPKDIQDQNSESLKSLNEYLRNITSENINVDDTKLTFYIKPDEDDERNLILKIKNKEEEAKKKGMIYERSSEEIKKEIDKEKYKLYGKIEIKLDGIKASTHKELRNKHYDTAVNTLLNTIQDYWVKEEKGELELDDDFELSNKGKMYHDWQYTVKPPKRDNSKFSLKRLHEIDTFARVYNEKHPGVRSDSMHNIALNNIYREKYGIPSNLEVRKPDSWMIKAIDDSYVKERTKLLIKYSIDPNLIFFHHELTDNEVGKCIGRIHGDHINDSAEKDLYREKMLMINKRLTNGTPNMMLMFYKRIEYLSIAPGFIHVPVNFDPNELNQYLKENIDEHRHKTNKFLTEYKQFEDVERDICTTLSIDGIERVADNNLIEFSKHLLAAKHFK